ncbi:hypothetical protein QTP88_025943 [Uroleucon formosanum]
MVDISDNDPKWTLSGRTKSMETGIGFHQIVSQSVEIIATVGMDNKCFFLSKNMEWSNDLILEFLELYEQEPCIWNPKHPQYKIRNTVYDSWENISKNLSVPYSISDLRKKKYSLMATFRKLVNKVKASKKTGSGLDIYKPDWFAYEAMAKFLHSVNQPNTIKSSRVSVSRLNK